MVRFAPSFGPRFAGNYYPYRNSNAMSTTDNLEQKAREWLNTEGYMHLGLRLTKRGHTGDSDLPEQVLAAFARSLAPAPPKVLSDEGLEAAAMEVIKAAWSKSSMVDGVKLLLDYFRMWRDRGGISFRTEPLPAPPKVLTDEKIERIADENCAKVLGGYNGIKFGLRYARDHYLATNNLRQ